MLAMSGGMLRSSGKGGSCTRLRLESTDMNRCRLGTRESGLTQQICYRGLSNHWPGSIAFRCTLPIRSPPARSSSARPRSSRSSSRTRSTPARRRIAVAIELGGKKLLRVEDDGEGMEPEDARLAIERHATSKIAEPDDLGGDSHARVPRRGAAEHRVGLAFRAAHARARVARPAPRFASTAEPSLRARGRRAARAPASRSPTSSSTCRRDASSSSPTPPSRRRSRGW